MPHREPISPAVAAPRILLIEDDVELAETLRTGLKPDGVELTIAGSRPEALASIRTQRFDAILLDLGIPGADGLELLQEFKQVESLAGVPVIVVTANNSTADKVRGFELGAVDYVTKPFELVELRARIRSTLRLQRLQSDLLAANADLHKARVAAEESAQAKADFLASMSHEIRTPMNGVIAMTGLLMQTDLAGDQRDFVETIRTSGESLLTIINDILNFSKLESGKMELEDRPFDLRACVEESLDLLAARAGEKGLDLAYQFDAQTPEQVVGDVTRVRQILVNLIGNAVKFTSSGEIFVRLTSHPLPAAGSTTLGPGTDFLSAPQRFELRFSVRDTGIGIPPDRLGRLFKSFTQVDSSIERQYGGTGLGLAISKGLVELMGGKLWVESEQNRGSTFNFTLPVPAAQAAGPASLGQIHKSLTGQRVLVVEDNAAVRQLIVETVGAWGMTATGASSVPHALEQAGKHPPQVAIVDLTLPGLDGATLISELRRLPNLQSLPVVALTPVGTRSDNADSAAGPWISLTKPIRPAHLQLALIQLQSGFKPAVQRTQPVSKLDSSMAARLPLRILLTDDNVINQKVALRLLQQLGYKADTANNGLEAVRALERQPYDVILMDVQMPEMDGIEATRRIRERQREAAPHPHFQRPLVIIAMTANAMQGDREKCIAAGMDDYLPKPVRPEGLQAMLELHGPKLAKPAVTPATSRENSASAPGASASTPAIKVLPSPPSPTTQSMVVEQPPVDMERLNEFAGGNLENFNELVGLYIKQTTDQLQQMHCALKEGDAERLSRVAHSCAGASATCGMSAIVPLLRHVERHGQEGELTSAAEYLPAIEREFERLQRYLETNKPIALAG
jgi:CheY-like chemotaxis protein/HPt (histidine-containing phosphotransfer) domain-containing protein